MKVKLDLPYDIDEAEKFVLDNRREKVLVDGKPVPSDAKTPKNLSLVFLRAAIFSKYPNSKDEEVQRRVTRISRAFRAVERDEKATEIELSADQIEFIQGCFKEWAAPMGGNYAEWITDFRDELARALKEETKK